MSVFYDDDFVGIGYCAHAVSYDENCLVFDEFRYSRLDSGLVFHVQGGGRFVQQYYRSVLEQGSGSVSNSVSGVSLQTS